MRLCYISGNDAWFTAGDVAQVWGDDWNDAPYEHNAGSPYTNDGAAMLRVRFLADSNIEHACDLASNSITLDVVNYDTGTVTAIPIANRGWSVQEVNAGTVPWLTDGEAKLYAGATVETFCQFIRDCGAILSVKYYGGSN